MRQSLRSRKLNEESARATWNGGHGMFGVRGGQKSMSAAMRARAFAMIVRIRRRASMRVAVLGSGSRLRAPSRRKSSRNRIWSLMGDSGVTDCGVFMAYSRMTIGPVGDCRGAGHGQLAQLRKQATALTPAAMAETKLPDLKAATAAVT